MEHSITSLMIVVGIAFFIPILLHRLKLSFIPVVVAEIIAGIIVGKSGLNLIHEDPWLEIMSLLGFIYLMFLSGLEIDFNAFDQNKNKRQKANPLKIGLVTFIGILAISFGLSALLVKAGLIEEPFLMTMIISTISLGVVVPVLKEKGILEKELGQSILLVAVISDFATMILLAVFVAYQSHSVANMSSLLLLFVFVFLVYRIIKRYWKSSLIGKLMRGTVQLGTRGVFALILLFVALAQTFGAEHILGSFLAGVIVSLLAPKREFIHQLDSFGYGFLIPIFFVMVGVNLDILALFKEPKALILIPILLIALYISKLIPVLVFKRYFEWKEVLASGMLLTSTLSLVIAASAIALELGFISENLNSALILVAILTCFISPLAFNKMLKTEEGKAKRLHIIGSNGITLPVSLDMKKESYEVQLFGIEQGKKESNTGNENEGDFPITEIEEITLEALEPIGAFETDVLVLGTSYDELNIELARKAKELGAERIIIRVENANLHKTLVDEGFHVFSTIFASRTLLKVLIEQPELVTLMSKHNQLLREIRIKNHNYEGVSLRQLPFLGDALIVQVYRGDMPIIPHGDTTLHVGDRLLVSGSRESIDKLRRELG